MPVPPADPRQPPPPAPRPQAPRPQAARAGRTRRIRRLTVAWTLTAFVAAWAGIFVQMRAGEDPGLGDGSPAAAVSSASAGASGGTGDDGAAVDSWGEDDDGAAAGELAPQPAAPSAATTAQS